MRRRLLLLATTALGLLTAIPAQQPKHIGYPQRDELSPFRRPRDAYAPPDEAYRLLRQMQAIAAAPGANKRYEQGRELVDDPRWRQAHAALLQLGLDAGFLAQIMRLNRNAADRATAFYAAFHVADVDHVFELIAHIPGEPERRTREAALPRAVEFARAWLPRRFGDLADDHKKALVAAMPEPGSPAATARGIVRLPVDQDHLHSVRLVPFLQLLDVDDAIDQAQALWFLKEVFLLRQDLALLWLEPSLPRLEQLLLSPAPAVREQTIGVFAAIGPRGLRPAPEGTEELLAWADEAAKALFPPIRNLNDAIVQLQPSPERDALVAAGEAALATAAIGDAFAGQRADGSRFRGFRVARVPDELRPLAIPVGAVITAVNGTAVLDGQGLLRTVKEQLRLQGHPRKLLVEYELGGGTHAVEYRVL